MSRKMKRVLSRESLLKIFKCYEHLPRREDAELTILKGHLLVESRIIEYISKKLPNQRGFKNDKFRFAQLLMIARSLCGDNKYANVWQSIDNLNNLRNKLAHELGENEYRDALNKFVEFHFTRFFKGQGDEYKEVHECVVSLYSSMVHLIDDDT